MHTGIIWVYFYVGDLKFSLFLRLRISLLDPYYSLEDWVIWYCLSRPQFLRLWIIFRVDTVLWGATNTKALKVLCKAIVLCKCLMIIIYSRTSSLENSRSISFHNDLTDGLWYLIPLNPQSSLIVDVVKGQIRAHAALLLSPFFQYLCHIQLLPSLSTLHVNLLPAGTIRRKK